MNACEKCWQDAYSRSLWDTSKSQSEHYSDLIRERADNPCSPDEQRYGNRVYGQEASHDLTEALDKIGGPI